jgi:glycosyltransferase involved in cell wall biosynthesis
VPGLRIVIVGEELTEVGSRPYGEFLRRRAAELGVNCELVPEVTADELMDYYRRARVLAVPSRQEGFSNVALEAMACGRPVVCTSNTGIAEIIEGSGSGAVVPVGAADRIADALHVYLATAESAAKSGRRARDVAEAECGPGRVASDTEACYREAIGRWRQRHVA